MKNILKPFIAVAILSSLFLFFSCDTEERIDTETISPHQSHPSLISIDEVLAKINSPKIKNTINNLTNTNLKSKLSDFESPEYFKKLTLAGHYDQYNLFLKGYTREEPYFLYYIITIDNYSNEKSGYLKYTPDKDSSSLDMRNFTGTLQLLNDNRELLTEVTMQQGQATSSLGTTECTNTLVVVTHNCTNGGEHAPGESCSGNFVNDAYYSFHVFTECWTEFDYGSPGNFIGGVGGGGGGISHTQAFYNSLTNNQQQFLNNNPSIKNAIYDYISSYGSSTVRAKQMIEVMIDMGIIIDIPKSAKSPMNIDLTSVGGNSPQEIRFRSVYNKLLQSPNFKKLFVNLFDNNDFINTKFKIEPINEAGVLGNCQLTTYQSGKLLNTITIDPGTLTDVSDVLIAQVIIHECIHAYLNVKLKNPNIGMSLNNINNMEFAECINTYYNNFEGPQAQHDFFVDYLRPIISDILKELKNYLLTPSQIYTVEHPEVSGNYIYAPMDTTPPISSDQSIPWNWDDYFFYMSLSGLQLCDEFNVLYPENSEERYYLDQYYTWGEVSFNQ